MNLPDLLERLLWTVLAAFLGGLTVGGLVDISAIDAAIVAGATAGVNFLTIVARARLAVLPDPGAGLPGLEVDDRGQSQAVTVLVIVILVIVILKLIGVL